MVPPEEIQSGGLGVLIDLGEFEEVTKDSEKVIETDADAVNGSGSGGVGGGGGGGNDTGVGGGEGMIPIRRTSLQSMTSIFKSTDKKTTTSSSNPPTRMERSNSSPLRVRTLVRTKSAYLNGERSASPNRARARSGGVTFGQTDTNNGSFSLRSKIHGAKGLIKKHKRKGDKKKKRRVRLFSISSSLLPNYFPFMHSFHPSHPTLSNLHSPLIPSPLILSHSSFFILRPISILLFPFSTLHSPFYTLHS